MFIAPLLRLRFLHLRKGWSITGNCVELGNSDAAERAHTGRVGSAVIQRAESTSLHPRASERPIV
jgi:hypothetical protein